MAKLIPSTGGVTSYFRFLLSHWLLTLITLTVAAVFLGGLLGRLYTATVGRIWPRQSAAA